jgi:hypothetical protein
MADNCSRLSDTEVQINISGPAGSRSYTLTVEQVSASPSVFASAIANSNDPTSAIARIDLSTYLTFDRETKIFAFQLVIRYMRTRGVNTAMFKRPFTAPTDSASGHYSFGFQISCILVAQKLRATRLVELLALEVRREWLRFPLRPKDFDHAMRVNGALDQFLIDWIIEIEHEEDEKKAVARQKALVRGVKEIRNMRNFLSRHFTANPRSRLSVLKFGEYPVYLDKAGLLTLFSLRRARRH